MNGNAKKTQERRGKPIIELGEDKIEYIKTHGLGPSLGELERGPSMLFWPGKQQKEKVEHENMKRFATALSSERGQLYGSIDARLKELKIIENEERQQTESKRAHLNEETLIDEVKRFEEDFGRLEEDAVKLKEVKLVEVCRRAKFRAQMLIEEIKKNSVRMR